MEKRIQHMVVQIFAFSLMALWLWINTNQALNQHVHILPDGSMVVHSHPYDKSTDNNPIKSHKHNNFELVLFSGLDFADVEKPLIIKYIPTSELKKFNSFHESNFLQTTLHSFKNKAPPVFFS